MGWRNREDDSAVSASSLSLLLQTSYQFPGLNSSAKSYHTTWNSFRPHLHYRELFQINVTPECVYARFDEYGIVFCESGKKTNPKSKVRTLYLSGYFYGHVNTLFRVRRASASLLGLQIILDSSKLVYMLSWIREWMPQIRENWL